MTNKGIDNLPEPRSGGRSQFVKVAQDGEYCRIRFLTEGDSIVSDYFHKIMQGKTFKGFTLCPSSVNKECDDCEEGESPQLQFLAHVFEYEHYYTEAGQNRKKTKVGNRTYYVEEVNEARLMRYAASHLDSIRLRWERNQTLLDRDFEWIRQGEKMDTRYLLEPLDPTKLSKDIKALIEDLEDLEEIALGTLQSEKPKTRRVRADQEDDDDDEEEAPKAKPKRRARAVAKDDDDDDDEEESESPF